MENNVIVTTSIVIETMINKAVTKALHEFRNLLEEKNENESILFNRSQAAEFLGISASTLYRWTQQKLIPSYGISEKLYYKKSELLESLVRTN